MSRESTASESGENQPGDAGLGQRTARGAGQMVLGQVVKMVLQVGSVVVLARLLTPVDYGLIAIVLVVVGFGEIVRDFGLTTAAIQAKTLNVRQRNVLWWINTGIGSLLAIATFIAAPAVAALFDDLRLADICRWLALTFVINGMSAQYRADLNRKLRFAALVVTDVASQIVGIFIGVALALGGAAYWSLVAQQLSQAASALLIMVVIGHWAPGLPSRTEGVRPLIRYGIGMTGSQFVGYVMGNVDTYAISLSFGVGPLGLYNRAYQLVMRPLSQLRSPSTAVALPALSRLQDNPGRAGSYLTRGQLGLGYPVILGLGFLAGASAPIVSLILGTQWSTAAPVFAALCACGAFQVVSLVGYWVFLSRALTMKLFLFTLFSLGLKVVAVVVGVQFGLTGVAVALACAAGIEWPLGFLWLGTMTPLPVRILISGACRILACGLAVAAAAFAGSSTLSDHSNLVQIMAALGFASATLCILFAAPWPRRDAKAVWSIARMVLGK